MQVRFWLVVATLALCLIGGGSSWETTLSLLYVRPVLILLSATFAVVAIPRAADGADVRAPMLLLALFAATMAIQLVPLPPGWWQALPGRQPYADVTRLVGQADAWRPISLSPDRTINSILALLPAAALLIGVRGLSRRELENLVPVVLAMIVASAVLGAAQWSGLGYLYDQNSPGFPTGFLVNRNHQAVFLSLGFPLLRVWLDTTHKRDGAQRPWRLYGALAATLFLVAIIVTTGSRAGLAATVAALVLSVPLTPAIKRKRWTRTMRRQAIGGVAISILLLGALFLFGRAVSFDRLVDADNYTSELRVRFTPLLIDLVRHYAWAGSGFGTFDAVFRTWEPDWALLPTYFNHAHNEVLEIAITGGIPALAVVTAFVAWIVRRIVVTWRRRDAVLQRLGGIMVAILGAASLVDYPLRTPLLGAVCALAVAWLATPAQKSRIDGSFA